MIEIDICKHLDSKFEEFLDKIECSKLRDALKEELYFAGGCIYCLRNDKIVKDYDLFLKHNYLVEELSKLDIWSYTSNYALTCGKFQVVIKYFGEPNLCVGQFDFKHNMHYYIPNSMKIKCAYMEEYFDLCTFEYEEPVFDNFKYLQTNELIFNEHRARDIEGVWLRVEKFVSRGMQISKETKKKIKKRITKKSVKRYKKSYTGCRSFY